KPADGRLVEEDADVLIELAHPQVGAQAEGLAADVVVDEAEAAARPPGLLVRRAVFEAEAVAHPPRPALLDLHDQVLPRGAEAGARQLDRDAGEDAEAVEVALDLQPPRLADRL